MKKILVIAEYEAKKLIAFHRALALAERTGASIDLIGFVHAPGVDNSELLTESDKKKVRQKLIDQKTAWLREKLDDIDTKNITLNWQVVWEKSVHLWTIERCKQTPYDLVIKTGRRSESLTYTPTDWHLIRQCAAPVMIVSVKKWRSKQCILATLDLSTETSQKIKLNRQVIETAQALSKITEQDVVYVYCIHIPRVIEDLEILEEHKLSKRAKESALEHVQKYYKKYDINPKQIKMLRGSVDKAINKAAKKESADMVIMGTMGRKGIKGKLIGNTAESVLHNLSTDVLTVKV